MQKKGAINIKNKRQMQKEVFFMKTFRLDLIFTRFRALFLGFFFFGYIFFRTLFPVILFPETLLAAPILFYTILGGKVKGIQITGLYFQ